MLGKYLEAGYFGSGSVCKKRIVSVNCARGQYGGRVLGRPLAGTWVRPKPPPYGVLEKPGKGVASESAFSFSNEDAEELDIGRGFLALEWTGTQDGQREKNKEKLRPHQGTLVSVLNGVSGEEGIIFDYFLPSLSREVQQHSLNPTPASPAVGFLREAGR